MLTGSSICAKRGFTLTELFISIVIVFVVGGIIYPIYTNCFDRKHTTTMELSQQKQLGLAFMQYMQDNDDRYPPASSRYDFRRHSPHGPPPPPYVFVQNWGPSRPITDGRVVPGLLTPYLKSEKIFRTPLIESDDKRVLEYMYNDLIAAQSASTLSAPAETVLLTGAENRLENVGHAYIPDSGPYGATFTRRGTCLPGQGASVRSARTLANGGAVFTFADGHTKWLPGGDDDPVFFPPRYSASRSHIDPATKKAIGPSPGDAMDFQGRHYKATFHLN